MGRNNLDTNQILASQYLGKEREIFPKTKTVDVPLPPPDWPKQIFLKSKEKKTEITEKVGVSNTESTPAKKQESGRKKGNSVTHKPNNQGYNAKIKQTISGIKQESFTPEFLDYAKYNRFKVQQKPQLADDTHELKINQIAPNMDERDVRKILIDLKIPFNFKADHKEEVPGMFKEGKLSILVKGKSEQISEWKEKVKSRGIELDEAKHQYPITSEFTNTKISTEKSANTFLEQRGEPGKVTTAIKNRKKEILEEFENQK